MRIGAFEVDEPAPELHEPHVISMLSPSLDAGSVGTLTLEALESHLGATKFARLARPGNFFDFTRYRPTVQYRDGERVYKVPNCDVSFARRERGPDLAFLHLMEPHAAAEEYIDSLLELLKAIGAKRLCRIGAMWDAVPHTRPLPVNQTARGQQRGASGARAQRRYEGPTSIMNLLTEGAEGLGIESVSLMTRLPYYARLEEDHMGVNSILDALGSLYDIPASVGDKEMARRQYREIDAQIAGDREAEQLVKRLEETYDAERVGRPESLPPSSEPSPSLSPEIERFLRELGDRLDT